VCPYNTYLARAFSFLFYFPSEAMAKQETGVVLVSELKGRRKGRGEENGTEGSPKRREPYSFSP